MRSLYLFTSLYIPKLWRQHINGGEASYLQPGALESEEMNENIYNKKLTLKDNENKSFHSLIKDIATTFIY